MSVLLIFIPLGVAIAISPNNGDSNPVIYGYILEWDARLERELTIEIPRVLLWFIGFRTPSNENPSGRIPIRLGPGRSPAPVQQNRGNVILRRRTGTPGGVTLKMPWRATRRGSARQAPSRARPIPTASIQDSGS